MTKSNHVDRLAEEVYLEFAGRMQYLVAANPVCEVCRVAPSVRVNRWGALRACCQNCLDEELRRFEEWCAENRDRDEFGW